jgi:O-antigen ligase
MALPTRATRAAGGVETDAIVTAVRRHGPAFAGWLLPFLLVLYLALKDGGYDAAIRGEVGIAVWWIVLVGAAVGALPTARINRVGWVGLGLLAGFALWTGLGIGWSESAERSVAELGRVAALLGVFALALSVQGRGAARRTAAAVAAATGVVAVLALVSRMEPTWIPAEDYLAFLPGAANRLAYPLGYWNGLGDLLAIGLPLVVWMAAEGRLTATRAIATAAVPAMSLALFLTLSRGGIGAAVIAILALIALHPRRVRLIVPLLLGAGGSALVIAAATQRTAFRDGLTDSVASTQGAEMLAMTLVVCGGIALIAVAFAIADKHGIGPRLPRPSRLTTGVIAGALALVVVLAALAVGAPGEISDRWQQFKEPNTTGGVERLSSFTGSNRYQYWQSALDANATDPLKGIGPGTYEFWWARDGDQHAIPGLFVRDAHSLFLETLAELGIIGLLLIGGFVVFVLATGTVRAFRLNRSEPAAALLAAATAGALAFAIAAALDWAWEMTVLPVCFLLLAAAILGRDTGPEDERDSEPVRGRMRFVPRGVLAAVAVAALIAVAIPYAGVTSVDQSQADVNSRSLESALSEARTASDVQPYAASPYLQQALIYELGGDYDAAARAASNATDEEPTNWRNWFVLSRIEAERGNPKASVDAFEKARSLNPKSLLFSQQ